MHHGIEMDFSKITEQIFVGTNFCCEMHFKKSLLDKGITANISLESEKIDRPLGVDYFLWLPTIDNTAPTMKQLGLGTQTLDYLVKNKIKVYVHCKNGHGRAPTLVAAYFISLGMTTEQAIKKIAVKRPEIHLEAVQRKVLRRLEKNLKK